MGQQKTIKLHTMIDGLTTTWGENGEQTTKPCPSIAELIRDAIDENPGYMFKDRIDVPTGSSNTRETILILEKPDPPETQIEKRNQIIAMLYQCMEKHDAQETLKLVDELIELK